MKYYKSLYDLDGLKLDMYLVEFVSEYRNAKG